VHRGRPQSGELEAARDASAPDFSNAGVAPLPYEAPSPCAAWRAANPAAAELSATLRFKRPPAASCGERARGVLEAGAKGRQSASEGQLNWSTAGPAREIARSTTLRFLPGAW